MDAKWYYGNAGQCLGPVSIEEIRRLAASDQLRAEDLVWRKGLTEWTPAGQVVGLFLPPPFPSGIAARSLPSPVEPLSPTVRPIRVGGHPLSMATKHFCAICRLWRETSSCGLGAAVSSCF